MQNEGPSSNNGASTKASVTAGTDSESNADKIPWPENLVIPDEIKTAKKYDKLVVFIGNGLSRLYGYPSWDELADGMLKLIYENEIISYAHYDDLMKENRKLKISIASDYFRKYENQLKYEDVLRGSSRTDARFKFFDDKLKRFLRSHASAILTTNYDDKIEKLLPTYDERTLKFKGPNEKSDQSRPDEKGVDEFIRFAVIKTRNDFKVPPPNRHKFILYLHGSMHNPQDMVVSTCDYLKQYEKENQNSIEDIASFLEGRTVLFLGYGFDEIEVLTWLHRIGRLHTWHLFWPMKKSQSIMYNDVKKYFKDLNINMQPYAIDKNGYESLFDVVEKISAKLDNIDPLQNRGSRIRDIDAWIKSIKDKEMQNA